MTTVIKVSERTAKLLKIVSLLDQTTQIKIADEAIEKYVGRRKASLKKRLVEIDKGLL